jgi:hypothetical protein
VIDPNLYPHDEELTTMQCAAAANVNRRTIVTWIGKGILPATRRPGKRGHYRVQWQHLYRALHLPAIPAQE